MSEPQVMTGEAAIDMLVAIRMDGFVTGYASAILTLAGDRPNADQMADALADAAAGEIEADPILMESMREQVLQRLAGVDSGPHTLTAGHHA